MVIYCILYQELLYIVIYCIFPGMITKQILLYIVYCILCIYFESSGHGATQYISFLFYLYIKKLLYIVYGIKDLLTL